MGSEASMRHRVLEMLAPLHAVAVENSVGPGTPDVNCSLGWIELKQIADWPVAPTTPVRIPHFRPGQRDWLRRRCQGGGAAWVLLRVGRSWTLVWGALAADALGHTMTRSDLVTQSATVQHWQTSPTPAELMKCLLRLTIRV